MCMDSLINGSLIEAKLEELLVEKINLLPPCVFI